MRFRASILVLALAGAALVPASAGATPYVLEDGSGFEVGCFEPCLCPILIAPLAGAFDLRFLEADMLFDNYEVSNVKWSFPQGDHRVDVTGSGRYRIGGEFALTHQLTLDLSVDGGPLQHFDSGLIVGGVSFPKLDIAVAVHGFYCYDSAFVVRAVPATAGVANRLDRPGIRSVRPNPFRDLTVVDFVLGAPGRADLRVLDLQGRQVRTLRSGRFEAGAYRAAWDGRGDDGRTVAAGLYLLTLDAGGRRQTIRITHLR